MDFNLILIMCFLVMGSSFTAYRLGVMQGIKATVNFIEENKLIEFDDEMKNDTWHEVRNLL